MTAAIAKLREWHGRFRKTPLAARVVAGLDKRAPEIWQRTFDLLQLESPEYRNSVDDEFTSESQSHCKELLRTIVAIASGRAGNSEVDPFGFVRAHAQWRARRQVPLIASLHAYRLAHKTYGGITKELLLQHPQRDEALLSLAMLSDFWIEFFDYIGSVLAEAHAAEEGLSVAQNTRAYSALIDDLLHGIEPRDPEARRLRTLCGIRPGAPMAVAIVRPIRSGSGDQADLEPALRSLGRLIQQELSSAQFGKLVEIRDAEVTVVVCSHSNPSRALLKHLRRQGVGRNANGLAASAGISHDTSEVAQLPEAAQEARTSLEFTTAAHPLVHFADIDLTEFLIRRADKTALRLIPEWTCHLTPPGGHSGELSRTIRAFAECSLNVKQTARRLGLHPNTVYFRLNQIRELTGTDPRTFSGISFLLTALRLLEIHNGGRT